MADYDSGEVTPRERKAADNQIAIAKKDAANAIGQFRHGVENIDLSDAQNRRLADVQLRQASRKASDDRFEMQRDLQSAALGLMGSLNQAANGSTMRNLMRMLESRNDKDNAVTWSQQTVNSDQVRNALDESSMQNVVALNDAAANAEKALGDIETSTAANLNNINPNLFSEPGTGSSDLGSSGFYDRNKRGRHDAQLSGYIAPDDYSKGVVGRRNRLSGDDYYSRLINKFNGR